MRRRLPVPAGSTTARFNLRRRRVGKGLGVDDDEHAEDSLYGCQPKNTGTPKSSILIGFSIISHPFWGFPPYFWKHPYNTCIVCVCVCESDRHDFQS